MTHLSLLADRDRRPPQKFRDALGREEKPSKWKVKEDGPFP